MPSRIATLLRAAAAQVPTVLTLAALAGIAAWGMRTGWQAPAFAALWGGQPDAAKAKADFLQSLTGYETRSRALQQMQSAAAAVSERVLHEMEASAREARIRMFSDQQVLLNFGLPVRWQDLLAQPEDQRLRRLRLLGLPEE